MDPCLKRRATLLRLGEDFVFSWAVKLPARRKLPGESLKGWRVEGLGFCLVLNGNPHERAMALSWFLMGPLVVFFFNVLARFVGVLRSPWRFDGFKQERWCRWPLFTFKASHEGLYQRLTGMAINPNRHQWWISNRSMMRKSPKRMRSIPKKMGPPAPIHCVYLRKIMIIYIYRYI
jgi:hypothetical protein